MTKKLGGCGAARQGRTLRKAGIKQPLQENDLLRRIVARLRGGRKSAWQVVGAKRFGGHGRCNGGEEGESFLEKTGMISQLRGEGGKGRGREMSWTKKLNCRMQSAALRSLGKRYLPGHAFDIEG